MEPQLREKLCKDQDKRSCRRLVRVVGRELRERERKEERSAQRRIERKQGEARETCNVKRAKPCPPRLDRSVVPVLPKGYRQEFEQRPNKPVSQNRRILSPQGKVLDSYAAMRRDAGKLNCLPTPLAAEKDVIQHSTPRDGKGTTRFAYAKELPRSLLAKPKRKESPKPARKEAKPKAESTRKVWKLEPSDESEEAEVEEEAEEEQEAKEEGEVASEPRRWLKPRSLEPTSNVPLEEKEVSASFAPPKSSASFAPPKAVSASFPKWGAQEAARGKAPASASSEAQQLHDKWLALARELLGRLGQVDPSADFVQQVAHELGPFYEEAPEDELDNITANPQAARQALLQARLQYGQQTNEALRRWFTEELGIAL